MTHEHCNNCIYEFTQKEPIEPHPKEEMHPFFRRCIDLARQCEGYKKPGHKRKYLRSLYHGVEVKVWETSESSDLIVIWHLERDKKNLHQKLDDVREVAEALSSFAERQKCGEGSMPKPCKFKEWADQLLKASNKWSE